MKLFTKAYSRELIASSRIVFFKFLPKIPFLGKCGLRASKCFVQNETRYEVVFGVQRGADSEFDSCFSNFVPKIPFLGKFVTKTSKCFVQNETRYEGVFRGANSEFDNYFFKFCPQNNFKFSPKKFGALFEMELGTKGIWWC